MNSAFTGLLFGLLGAVVLIYFLIVVNFQSWSDPFVIITALPAALAGIVCRMACPTATRSASSVPAASPRRRRRNRPGVRLLHLAPLAGSRIRAKLEFG